MLKVSKKKVKRIYVLMYISFFLGLAVIAAGGIFSFLWISLIPAAVCIGISVFCEMWLRATFSCPKCTNCLIRTTDGTRRSFIVDPLNQYERYCYVCGERIVVKITDVNK